jgi:hypothetical protein
LPTHTLPHLLAYSAIFFRSARYASEISGGKYPLKFYDDRANVEKYLAEIHLPYTAIHLGMFLENLVDFKWLSKNEDGSLVIKVCDTIYYIHTNISKFTICILT